MFVQKTEFKFRNSEQKGDRMSINKTAVKTMDILELFYKHEELSLTEMVQLTSMPKTSVYRLIGSLEEMEFLTKKREGEISFRGRIFTVRSTCFTKIISKEYCDSIYERA